MTPTKFSRDLVRDRRTRELLWDAIRILRARLFNVSRPSESVRIVAEAECEEIVRALAMAGFTPNWKLSYHYEGEDANLVRFWCDPAREEYPFRQDHARLFIDEYPPGEVGVLAHTEASALVHREAHIQEETFDWMAGTERVRDILDANDIPMRVATD